MPDYKELYLKLFGATEDAIQCLIASQQACEEAYLSSPEPELKVLDFAQEVQEPVEEESPHSTKKADRIWKGILVGVGILLAFLVGTNCDLTGILPEIGSCAICSEESHEAPCLLDVSSGEIGEMRGSMVPGVFQYIDCAGICGAWDSDAKSYCVSLPETGEGVTELFFCRDCRKRIKGSVPGTYAVLDLSAAEGPAVYPVVEGVT